MCIFTNYKKIWYVIVTLSFSMRHNSCVSFSWMGKLSVSIQQGSSILCIILYLPVILFIHWFAIPLRIIWLTAFYCSKSWENLLNDCFTFWPALMFWKMREHFWPRSCRSGLFVEQLRQTSNTTSLHLRCSRQAKISKKLILQKIKKIRILPLSYRTFFQKTFHVINTNILFVHRGKCFKVYTVEILLFIHLKLVDFFKNILSSIYWTQVILVFWCSILAADGISPFDMITTSSLRKGLFQVETKRFF